MQMGRSAVRSAVRVKAPVVHAAHAMSERREDRTASRETAVAQLAGERLDVHARKAVSRRQEEAARVAASRPQLERELRAIDRKLMGYDETRVAARARGIAAPVATEEQGAMLDRRRAIQEELASSRQRQAQQIAAHADRNAASLGA